jgi:hypothetical protein
MAPRLAPREAGSGRVISVRSCSRARLCAARSAAARSKNGTASAAGALLPPSRVKR